MLTIKEKADYAIKHCNLVQRIEKEKAKFPGEFDYLSNLHIAELANQVKKDQEKIEKLKSSLGDFVEYFGAIKQGEYVENGRAARLRHYELVILNNAADLLGWECAEFKTKG